MKCNFPLIAPAHLRLFARYQSCFANRAPAPPQNQTRKTVAFLSRSHPCSPDSLWGGAGAIDGKLHFTICNHLGRPPQFTNLKGGYFWILPLKIEVFHPQKKYVYEAWPKWLQMTCLMPYVSCLMPHASHARSPLSQPRRPHRGCTCNQKIAEQMRIFQFPARITIGRSGWHAKHHWLLA